VIDHLLSPVLSLSGPLAYALVGALAFGEAAFLLGFVIPGETAVILGGVLASNGRVALWLMVVVACAAAVAGDTVGYEVGRVLGPRILGLRPVRRRQHAFDRARAFLVRRGWWAVFIGRFTAFLRAVMPGLAGMSGMHYPKFLSANATGGIIWATGFTMLGYLLGHAYRQVEKFSGWASEALVGVVVLALMVLWIRGRIRERREESAGAEDPSRRSTVEHLEETSCGQPAGTGSPPRAGGPAPETAG
jgi:membrane-associated protein